MVWCSMSLPPWRWLFNFWFAIAVVQLTYAYMPLSDSTLNYLPNAGDDFDINSGAILAPILIPRVPGTPGSMKVQKHLIDFFRTHLPAWTVELHNSTSKTPATGDEDIPFVNIICTRDPPWARAGDVGRLALVAHYDSKLTPAGFLGATDSAVPCAIIMLAARSVDEALSRKWAAMAEEDNDGLEPDTGVQIIFMDGEEAFLAWTHDDSIYGAKALAETWENQLHVARSTYPSAINSIRLFLLLDLLGSADPKIDSYYATTHWAYQNMAYIEQRLRSQGLLQSKPKKPFLADTYQRLFPTPPVLDDHIPFLQRGVECLHIVPFPFPSVWHQITDDGEHLDMPTVEDWAKIITAFVGEWMDLEGFLQPQTRVKAEVVGRTEL